MFLILGSTLNLLASFFWGPDSQGVTAGTLVALSCFCWLVGLIGLYDRLRATAPRYVAVALPVTVFATVGGVAFGVQSIHEGLFDVSHAQTIDLLNQYPFATTLFWIAGPLFPLTLFALGVALGWTRTAPPAVGVLLCLGAIAFPMSRITREVSIAHVADVLLLLPFLYLGARGLWGRSRKSASSAAGDVPAVVGRTPGSRASTAPRVP
ncbi:hypothetical protein [Micromonospora avicenniae]|uniref:Uncharacterized protein n=1 Tax=Micromonospora avicenniae TaxID=1198245 RepID=A0A1N6QBA0_9ACTN|nr:hypothetical protein [Micromonospora avicenniae]SIQ13696.1 hypothetical protein SAMN05444858_101255 [Micromonospora avicenniae]